jgi:hypothetical protein
MNIVEATRDYEAWLGRFTPLLKPDLKLKHERMQADAFSFLRATYYRWAQIWPKVCPDGARAPVVLAVGDLHVENFGTWRDVDGRLVWGINDFDECYPLAYTNDLTRLAVSAWLAIAGGELAISAKSATTAILEGYRECVKEGGRPFVLADSNTPLRAMARERLDRPERFWEKLHRFPPLNPPVPKPAVQGIRELLPDRKVRLRFVHRIAGLGSLGKLRFTALGNWSGGLLAREAKAMSPSACLWALRKRMGRGVLYGKILEISVRCPDPMVRTRGEWLIRRLSPDCFRIELSDLPKKRDESDLLYSMGWETANVHLGSRKTAAIRGDLKRRHPDWLRRAAKLMRDEVLRDWKVWRKESLK